MRRTVHGGLEIVPLPRVTYGDVEYGLISSRFNTDHLPEHLMDQANEILEYLNQKEPSGLNAYANKQKAYNRLLMLYDQMSQSENKTGPHTVKLCSRLRNGVAIYGVTLSIDYCDRNSKDMKSSSVIILEPYEPQMRQQSYESFHKGRVTFIDERTQTVHFNPFSRTMPEGNYMVRFLPSQFVYNSRDHIMNELLENQRPYRFLIFPPPLDENITKEQYLEVRDLAIAKCQFSSKYYNQEQREAIVAIFSAMQLRIQSKNGNLLPFILHGPPGTGKTTTLVEACRLLEEEDDHAKILVCTPSNTAADLFAYELIHVAGVKPTSVFRLNALTHPTSELKEALKDIVFMKPNNEMVNQFGIPPVKELMQYRIVVCTLLCSTYLALGGMKDQFSHIIVDEAGQASELDTLVPIVGLLGGKGAKVVLAGDPRQLGPVEMIEYFKKNGISSSLIERYETNPNYRNDPRIITLLRANYRSHPSIIEVPSRLFYNNELHVPADAQRRDSLATWKALPKQGFPIFWHHVNTPEEKELDGHSYSNKGEMAVVHDYIKRVCTELCVKPSDIGVVAPYNYQMRRLRRLLGDEHKEVTVDTVERYQGSQRRVIIISTVRNNEKDALGFMMSDKRFNTVITRAEELLIIVGNAKVMMKDPSWKEMIDYCRKNEATVDMPSEAFLFSAGEATNGQAEASDNDDEEEEELVQNGTMDTESKLREKASSSEEEEEEDEENSSVVGETTTEEEEESSEEESSDEEQESEED
ncbi:Helicase MOV-10 [Globodera pallida]|nr:Helicase MOV-10 [Globodera pallida]